MTRSVEARGRNFNERLTAIQSKCARGCGPDTPPRISRVYLARFRLRGPRVVHGVMDGKQLTTASLARYEGGIRIIL